LKFEPRLALFSQSKGLAHYKKLFRQIDLLFTDRCSLFIEISPEQKPEVGRILRRYKPKAKIQFFKDLAEKWRVSETEL